MKNELLLEGHQIKQAGVPADLNTTGLTGARIALKEFDKVTIVISMGDSTGATVQATLRQHDAASAGTSKDLDTANPYFHKVAAADVFTKVEPTVAAALVDASAQFAADEGILVLEVKGEQLDVNNGFSYVSVNIADPAAAKIMAVNYILGDARKKPAYDVATV